MNWERTFFSRLILAVPEIAFAEEVLKYAVAHEWISQKEIDSLNFWKGQVNRGERIVGKLSSRSFTERLLIIAPELVSIQSVNLMRRLNLIDDEHGHKLRLFVRSLTATGAVPGSIPSDATIARRLQSLAGVYLSQETIDLYRIIPVSFLWDSKGNRRPLTVEEADSLRSVLIGVERLKAARQVLREGDGLVDRIFLVAGELLNERMIRAGVMAGVISPNNALMLNAAIKLGRTAWKTSTRVWNAAGFEQRALIASTGLFSQEMIQFLRRVGIIDAGTARTLETMASIGRSLARSRLDAISQINRSYRVLPGESPIATYARLSRETERDLLALLDQAARETQAKIARLAPQEKIGARTRAAQERILLNSLYNEMRSLWEGVGYLTIIGEKNAARAAVDSMDFLQRRLWRREDDIVRRALRETGRAGVDSLISREENIRPLSRRVYKNLAFSNQLISRRIKINLLRGVSAQEFAKDIASLIRPSVRGGISYAAQRLARTEMNNAFHLTAIRYTREMPWVTGYKWNLSGTHRNRVKGSDVCDDYATEDGYGIGPGNFPKRAVPSKPHPQCLCFTTIITMPVDQFRENYRRGTFNQYIRTRERAGLFSDEPDVMSGWAQANIWVQNGVPILTKSLAAGAIGVLTNEILRSS